VVNALVTRDYRIQRSYRFALATDLLFGVVTLAIYYFISRTFGPPRAKLGGAPTYFAFAAIGVALGVVIQAASIGLGRRVREDQLTGTLEALVAQPVKPSELALGIAGFPFLFAIFRAVLYLSIAGGLLGLDFSHADWPGTVISLGVTATAFTSVGVTLAAAVLLFRRSEAVAGMLAVGLTFLGGALFPVSQLPDWLEPLSVLVPTRYAFDGLRAAIFGTGDWGQPVLVLLGFTALALPLAIALFARALLRVQQRATLSQY
jgi:ABC-type multidrug transport system permease subunit